jgi:hypothetical protein
VHRNRLFLLILHTKKFLVLENIGSTTFFHENNVMNTSADIQVGEKQQGVYGRPLLPPDACRRSPVRGPEGAWAGGRCSSERCSRPGARCRRRGRGAIDPLRWNSASPPSPESPLASRCGRATGGGAPFEGCLWCIRAIDPRSSLAMGALGCVSSSRAGITSRLTLLFFLSDSQESSTTG